MVSLARLPPLNALKGFEASGRHLNFRPARGLALTEEGRKYHTPIQRAFELISAASNELRPQQDVITISVTPSFATKWLVPRLAHFTAANPDLNVQIVAPPDLANFRDDGIDLAVRQGRAPKVAGLVSAPLFPSEFYAVCSPALLDGKHPLLTPEDLKHHVLLLDGHGLWPLYIEQVFGGKPSPKFALSSSAKPPMRLMQRLPVRALRLPAIFLLPTTLLQANWSGCSRRQLKKISDFS